MQDEPATPPDEQTQPPHQPQTTQPTSADRMNEALRTWYAAFNDLGRQFAVHLGIHGSDAAALVQITAAEDRDAPLTQAQLAQRIGLTTPATSSLLNRLEDNGHIERHRSRVDRRVVTLRSTQAMHDEVHRFFHDVSNDLDHIAGAHSDATLDQFTSLITDMTHVMHHHLQAMTEHRTARTTK